MGCAASTSAAQVGDMSAILPSEGRKHKGGGRSSAPPKSMLASPLGCPVAARPRPLVLPSATAAADSPTTAPHKSLSPSLSLADSSRAMSDASASSKTLPAMSSATYGTSVPPSPTAAAATTPAAPSRGFTPATVQGEETTPRPRSTRRSTLEADKPLRAPPQLAPLRRASSSSPRMRPPPDSATPSASSSFSPRPLPCFKDGAHVATVYCQQCEQNLCAACDSARHGRRKSVSFTHTRVPLSQTNSSSSSSHEGGVKRPPALMQPHTPSANADEAMASPPAMALPPHALARMRASLSAKDAPAPSPSPPLPSKKLGSTPRGSLIDDRRKSSSRPTTPTNASSTPSHRVSRAPAVRPSPVAHPAPTPKAAKASSLPREQRFICAVPFSQLRSLTPAQLSVLFTQYDEGDKGVLSGRTLKLLASDCLWRLERMISDEIRSYRSSISNSDLQTAVEKEVGFMLAVKDDPAKELLRRLLRRMDKSGEGNISRTELSMQWNAWAQDFFQIRKQEALECSIM